MKTVLLASPKSAVTSASSFAGTPWINARQNAQANRINNGVVSGRLTPTETTKLVQGQAHVQNLKNQANADGVVTLFERRASTPRSPCRARASSSRSTTELRNAAMAGLPGHRIATPSPHLVLSC